MVWRADTLWTCVLLYIFLLIYDGNVSTTPSVSFCVCEARLRVQPLVMFFGGVQRKLFPATTARHRIMSSACVLLTRGLPFIFVPRCLGLGRPCCRKATDTCLLTLARPPPSLPRYACLPAPDHARTQIPNPHSLTPSLVSLSQANQTPS